MLRSGYYMERVTVREINDFYENELRKNIKNKKRIIKFEMNKEEHIKNIVDVLNGNKEFKHVYNIFLIFEPKARLIMALNIEDKIVNHYFTTKYLYPSIKKKLDDRNVATRTGMGTRRAIQLVRRYMEYYKRKNKNIYILKLDINKYFYSIDHNVLKRMLYEDLVYDDYLFICKIIDSTNYDYINKKISLIRSKYNIDIPFYEYGKGIPIGNLSSQTLSIYYLNRLDHYIVHDLKLKCYVRYMDDILILYDDKEYLYKCKDIITNILYNEYKLIINNKKTFITNIKNSFIFLGYRFTIKNNKTIMCICNKSICNIKNKIKKNNNLLLDKYFESMVNYYFSYDVNYIKRKNIVDNSIIIKR